jgi:sigma-B regulation protein RsbU (phosphoserine phosphatase)
MSIVKKIKAFFLRMILVILFIIGCLVLFYFGRLVYKEIFKKHVRIEYIQSHLKAEIRRINSVIDAIQKIPNDLANILEIHETRDEDAKILLQSVLLNNNELYAVSISYEPFQYYKDSLYHDTYLYRSADTTIYDNIADTTYNYFYMDWYLIPKILMKPIWTEPYFEASGDHVYMSTFSVPFFHFDGKREKFKGIVTVDVSIETLTKRVDAIGKKMNGSAMMVSENGTIMTAPDRNWINDETIFTLSAEKKIPVLREIGRDLQRGISGIKKIDAFENLKDVYIFYSVIPINKWGFVLFLPKEELDKY